MTDDEDISYVIKEKERRDLLQCAQCGQPLWNRACGPTHAVRWCRVEDAVQLDPSLPARIYNHG